MVIESESKRALVRHEPSETDAPIMLGRRTSITPAPLILLAETAQPAHLRRQTEQRRANFLRTVRRLRRAARFALTEFRALD
jgi:hypothetical protein